MAMHAHEIQDSDRVEVHTRFGTLPVPRDNLLTFPEGLPGFDRLYRFALFHDEENPSVFYLQSLDDAGIRLPVVSPHWFAIDYRIVLDEAEEQLLRAEAGDEFAVLITLADDGGDEPPRANFHGPIIVNLNKRIAMQKALRDPRGHLVINAH